LKKVVLAMALQTTRIDVTDRIIGKLNGRSLELYEEGELIGRLPLPAAVPLKKGYTEQNGRIYKQVTATVEPDQKYVDCDGEAGWC
jgi:hypothetical protein